MVEKSSDQQMWWIKPNKGDGPKNGFAVCWEDHIPWCGPYMIKREGRCRANCKWLRCIIPGILGIFFSSLVLCFFDPLHKAEKEKQKDKVENGDGFWLSLFDWYLNFI